MLEEYVSVDINKSSHKAYLRESRDVMTELGTSEAGLSSQEVARRIAEGKKNALEEKEKESLLKRYLEQFSEPLILLLLGSAVISILIGQYNDAFTIILAVTIVSTVGFIQEYRSEKSVEALTQFVAHKCEVVRDGRVSEVSAEELVIGDIVVLNRGNRVPADVRLFEAIDLRIDESILTGESNPTKKSEFKLEVTDSTTGGNNNNSNGNEEDIFGGNLTEHKNMAFMGTMIIQGKGRGIVVATGDDSELGRISQMIQNTESQKTPLQNKMDQLGKHLSIMSFGSM